MKAIGWMRTDGTLHRGCPPMNEPKGWTPVYELSEEVPRPLPDYAKHEVLDRVNLFAQMIGLFLLEEELVKSREDLHGPIQIAHDTLMEVYQALGVEHLVPEHFDEEEGEQGMPVPVREVREYSDDDMIERVMAHNPLFDDLKFVPVEEGPLKYVPTVQIPGVNFKSVPGAAMPEVRPFPTFDQPVIPSNTITPEITAQRRQAEKAQCWDDLMEACGHWQDGSGTTVILLQDDAVRECGIRVGREGPAFWSTSFEGAIRVMKETRG